MCFRFFGGVLGCLGVFGGVLGVFLGVFWRVLGCFGVFKTFWMVKRVTREEAQKRPKFNMG